jgi:hypothetical protein
MTRRQRTIIHVSVGLVAAVIGGLLWSFYQATKVPTDTRVVTIQKVDSPDAESTDGSTPQPQLQNPPDQLPSIVSQIPPPTGFRRVSLPATSFGVWLRALLLRTGQTKVHLFDGSLKRNQSAHFAILDVDVGPRDLQQCADAVIRLRAEYLFSSGCPDSIQFNFTSGNTAQWTDWREGMRPRIAGNQVTWNRTATPDVGYDNFRSYLDSVFSYAGSASLERELLAVTDPQRLESGDVFIQGGYPGHAVIIVDVAADQVGRRVFLLAQSFMPAQDIHILKSFDDCSPWYYARSEGTLHTPEWEFFHQDLKRFPRNPCEMPDHIEERVDDAIKYQ